jgi:hypothetical protein
MPEGIAKIICFFCVKITGFLYRTQVFKVFKPPQKLKSPCWICNRVAFCLPCYFKKKNDAIGEKGVNF